MKVKKFWRKLLKKKPKKKLGEHYDSIDNLPIWNWNQIHKTGDYKHLIISGEVDGLENIWMGIYDEYIEMFGLYEGYKNYLEKQRKLILLELNFAITEDRTLLNWIQIVKLDLQKIRKKKNEETASLDPTVQIEKYLGFQIDEKTTSVKKYYGYIELMKLHNGNNR